MNFATAFRQEPGGGTQRPSGEDYLKVLLRIKKAFLKQRYFSETGLDDTTNDRVV